MFKLAVIGTNWISQQFVEAAIQTKQFCLKAVYSRDIKKKRVCLARLMMQILITTA